MKGIPTEAGFEEVPEDEIIRGYEHSKGQHVFLRSEEIDDLKLEAKHTIDMVLFVDAAEVDSRYWEKPYYLTADGDDADEGYTVIREPSSRPGRWPSVGWSWEVEAIWSTSKRMSKKGLMLSILRYAQELHDETPYFDLVTGMAEPEAVALITKQSGKLEPETMPNQFTAAVKEYLRAKVEQRAPEVTIEKKGKHVPQVINIMDGLKKSTQAEGRTKVASSVGDKLGEGRERLGKVATFEPPK